MLSAYRFDVWFAIYICAVALTQLLGAKTTLIALGPISFHASISVVLLPFVFGMLDVVLERFGRMRVNGMLCAGLGATVFAAFASLLALALTSSVFEQSAYQFVFGNSLRFTLTSLLSFGCLQLLNLRMMRFLQGHMDSASFSVRILLAAGVALGVDTFVFTFVDHVEMGFGVLTVFFPYWIFRWFIASFGVLIARFGWWFFRFSRI